MVRAVPTHVNLDGLKLPPAPQTLIQLIEICHQSEVDFDQLHRVVSRDAALVSRILTVAHSAAYSQWSEVDDLRRLLVALGIDTVKSLALTAAVQQFFSSFSQARGEILGRQWMDALICAHLNRSLTNLIQFPETELAWITGLLHRVGRLVLLENDPEEYPLLSQQATDNTQLLRLEQKRYGFDSCELGARLVEQWGEMEMADAIRFQYHAPLTLLDSSPLVKMLNRSAQWTLLHSEPEQAVLEDGLFDLQQDLLIDLLANALGDASRDARNLAIDTDPTSHYPVETLDNEQTRLQLARHVQTLSLLQASENGLEAPEEPQQLLLQLQRNLRILLGFPRSLTLLPGKDGKHLVGVNDSIQDFEILLEDGRSRVAESALLQKPMYLKAPANTSAAVIDLQLLERLGRDEALCLPLVAKGQLQGLLLLGFDTPEKPRIEERRLLVEQLAERVAQLLLYQRLLQQEQHQALEQQRMEIEFHLRELSHEIRNPLTTIRNYLELLSRQIQDDEARPHIETIKLEIDRVGKLLRQLRNPGVPLELDQGRAVDVNQLIEGLVELYRPSLRSVHDIHCKLRLAERLPPQRIDRNRLKQVLTNLLRNASEALPPGGVVEVQTRFPVIVDGKNCFEISVSDNGPGVDPEILPRLFTPVATTKGGEHAGLGLSIVHRLVQELGGSIRYGQSAEGGAEFTLQLPMHPVDPASTNNNNG